MCSVSVSASACNITQLTVQLHNTGTRHNNRCRCCHRTRRCRHWRPQRRFLLLVSLTFQMFLVCLHATIHHTLHGQHKFGDLTNNATLDGVTKTIESLATASQKLPNVSQGSAVTNLMMTLLQAYWWISQERVFGLHVHICSLLIQMLHVACSVWLCICELCNNGWTNWDAIWGLTHVSPMNHEFDGGPDPPWEWALLNGHVPAHCNRPTNECTAHWLLRDDQNT